MYPPTVFLSREMLLNTGTPLRWLYSPVRMPPRLGVQMGLVQKQFERIMPLRAISSMCGVLLIREPYAPIACAAWSSVMMYRMFSRRAFAAERNPPPQHLASAAVAAVPEMHALLVETVFMSFVLISIYRCPSIIS